ncbi:MAG: hypothetical protein C4518_07125 [Desulfobacteraceae bacterium]|nr:MAG: hypothetical protein C4518_07125 [Desulfobacteraceae bacterium]
MLLDYFLDLILLVNMLYAFDVISNKRNPLHCGKLPEPNIPVAWAKTRLMKWIAEGFLFRSRLSQPTASLVFIRSNSLAL